MGYIRIALYKSRYPVVARNIVRANWNVSQVPEILLWTMSTSHPSSRSGAEALRSGGWFPVCHELQHG